MSIKSILKTLKTNESTISMLLGAAVIVVTAILVIRYFRNIPTGTTLPEGGVSTEQGEVVPLGSTYIVEAGDNLWKIAEKHYQSGYNWVDVAQENNLADPGQIEVGQELTIPNVQSKQVTVAVKSSENEITSTTYTVVNGDSLWDIAVRAYGDGYQWIQIAQENDLANPNLIHPGNILILPR